MFDQTHAHITTWVLGAILFVVAFMLLKKGNEKGSKIVHMVLRLMYILILVTGFMLFTRHSSYDPALYGIKMLGGIIAIAMMEMVLVRSKKGKKTAVLWAILGVAFIVTFLLGVKLPLGWNWLA